MNYLELIDMGGTWRLTGRVSRRLLAYPDCDLSSRSIHARDLLSKYRLRAGRLSHLCRVSREISADTSRVR